MGRSYFRALDHRRGHRGSLQHDPGRARRAARTSAFRSSTADDKPSKSPRFNTGPRPERECIVTSEATEENTLHHVVINDEEQYSIWAAGRDVPAGWRIVGEPGPKGACLDY